MVGRNVFAHVLSNRGHLSMHENACENVELLLKAGEIGGPRLNYCRLGCRTPSIPESAGV